LDAIGRLFDDEAVDAARYRIDPRFAGTRTTTPWSVRVRARLSPVKQWTLRSIRRFR